MRKMVPYAPGGVTEVYRHDEYFQIGPLRMSSYPRLWAALLVVGGAILMVSGTFIILHVAYSTR
jgi:hypothetical protein